MPPYMLMLALLLDLHLDPHQPMRLIVISPERRSLRKEIWLDCNNKDDFLLIAVTKKQLSDVLTKLGIVNIYGPA